MNPETKSQIMVSWLALFASMGTLVCCAIPIVLVTLGLGATVVAMTNSFPTLIVLSEKKAWVFGISAALLLISAWTLFRPGRTCPTDPFEAQACNRAHTWNRRVLVLSAVIWSVGFSTAYLALPLRNVLGL